MLQTSLIEVSDFVLVPCTGTLDHKPRKHAGTQNRQRKTETVSEISSSQLSLDLTIEQAIARLANPILAPDASRRHSEKARVSIAEAEQEQDVCEVAVPYEPWGEAWVMDKHDLRWSIEGLKFLRVRVFWESFDELALSNNEREKWDILKWIFKPVIRKHFVFGQPVVEWHQNDEFFSFHNCCLAVGMDEDVIREGIVRNVDPEIIEAVLRVCAH